MRKITGLGFAAALMLTAAPALGVLAIPVAAHAQAEAEATRFTAFIDNEFEQELKLRPQRATALGRKQDNDKWDDISDAGQLKVLEWRRASVARMKAQFDRAKLPPHSQASYDMWALELDRAELTYKFRRYQPPFYSFLYSVHSELPNFLINRARGFIYSTAPSPISARWRAPRAGADARRGRGTLPPGAEGGA